MKAIAAVSLFVAVWCAVNVLTAALPFDESFARAASTPLFLVFLALYLAAAAGLSVLVTAEVIRQPRVFPLVLCAALLALSTLLVLGERQPAAGFFPWAVPHSAGLLCAAALAGAMLSSAIKRVGELVPLCCTAAAADMASVAKGPTSRMITEIASYYQGGMRGEAPLVDFFLVKAVIPGHQAAVPLFGVTDWILVSLLAASLQRLVGSAELPAGKYGGPVALGLGAATAGLYVSLVSAAVTGLFVPAMAFIAFAFLLFLALCGKLRRQMRRTDLFYSVLAPAAVGLLVFVYAP